MTNFGAGYKIESKESRALASITADSYDYRDQAKLLSKLTGDVEYLAQYSRQMQKGIDAANQNFIQQIGDFINEIITVIGGGGNTGFDFGDLRYVLQAIGSLFGFDEATGIASVLPINLFSAAWHFFSTYILPIDNFGEWADNFIDQIFATLLDIFGEIPLLGQALQQFAVWITGIRDLVSAFNDLIGSWTVPFVEWLEETVAWLDTTVGGWLSETVTWISETFFGWTEPIATWIWDSVSWLATILAGWTQPVVDTIVDAVNWVLEIFSGWTESLTTWITNSLTGLTTVFGDWSVAIADWVRNTLDWLETTFTTWTEPIATWVTSSVTWLTETFAAWTAPIATWITDSVTWLTEAFAAWTEPIATWVNSSVDWLMGLFDGGLGTLAQSMVTGLTDSFANVNNWVQDVIDAVIGALTGIPIIGGAIQGIVNGFQSLFNGLFGQPAPSTVLAATAVPGLDGTKITTGSVAAERIAALDAAKITTGQLAEARIADMNAAKITSGTFGNDRIADGAINNVKISDIAGEKVTAGSVAAARIASLDASKITTGSFPQSQVTDLTTDLGSKLPSKVFDSYNASGASVCTNPSFENTDGYLGYWGATYSTAQKRTGNTSVLHVADGNNKYISLVTSNTAEINFVGRKGQKFYLEAWAYVENSTPQTGSDCPIGMGVWWYNTQKTVGSNVSFLSPTFDEIPLNQWFKISGIIEITNSTAALLRPLLYIRSVATSGNYYFDDVVVREITESVDTNQALYSSNTPASTVLANAVPALDASKITSGQLVNDRIATLQQNKVNGLITSLKTKNNLVSNPGFENPIFYMGNATYSTEVVRSGYYSAKIVGTGSGQWTWLNTYDSSVVHPAANPGDVIYMECWIYGSPSNTINSSSFSLYAQGLSGSGANLENLAAASIGANTDRNGVWTKWSGYRKLVHADIRQVTLGIYTTCAAGEVYYLDDAVVRFVTDANEINQALYGGNYTASTVIANAVPALDASKITTGQVVEARISDLSQSKITSLTKHLGLLESGVARGQNLFDNPSFENTDFTISASANREYSTEQARSGIRSVKLSNYTYFYLFQRKDGAVIWKPCRGGDWVYVEAYIYGHANNVDTTSNSYIQVCWINAAGVQTSCTNATGWTPYGSAYNGVWTKMSGIVQAPDGTVGFNPVPVVNSGGGANIYYWDDVDIRIITESVDINQALYNAKIPASTVLANVVPSLDASKLTSGTVNVGLIPELPQSQITSLTSDLSAITTDSSNTLNYLYDAFDGTEGNTGKTALDVRNRGAAVRNSAVTGETKSTQAQAAIAGYAAGNNNLIFDPDCSRADMWPSFFSTIFNIEISTEQFRSSPSSLKLTRSGSAVYPYIPALYDGNKNSIVYHVKPGDVFYACYWVRAHASNANTQSCYIQFSSYDSTGQINYHWTNHGSTLPNSTGWTKIEGYYTVPAGYDRLNCLFGIGGSGSVIGDSYYLDDMLISNITETNAINKALYNANAPASTIIANSVPSLDGTKITTGTVAEARIANLAQSKITNLTTDLSNRVDFDTYGSLTSGGDNLCTNPGFEDTSQYIRDATFVTDIKLSGTYSAKITTNGTSEKYISLISNKTGTIHLKGVPSQRFYIEFNVYGDDANTYFTGTTTFLGIGIWCYDKTSVSGLGTGYVSNVGTYLTANQIGKGAWVKHSAIIEIPSTETIAYFYPVIRITTVAPTGNSFYFDDIVLRNVTEITNTNKALYNANVPSSSVLSSVVPSLDASKITTGTIGTAIVPSLDAGKITTGAFGTARIPNLPGSIINSGSVAANYIASLDATKITTGTFGTTQIPSLDSGKITTGTLGTARIPNLPGSIINSGTVGSTYIAALDATKITTGTFGTTQIPSLDSGKITTGTLGTARIPNLPGSIINSGTVASNYVASLDASKITSGTFANAYIASGLDAAKLTTGTLPTARIGSGAITNTYLGSDINGGKITAGTVLSNYIAALDASKITTGEFAQSRIVNLESDFGDTWDSVVSGLQRVTSSGNTTADVEAITNAIAQSLQNNSSAIAAMQSESSGGAATGISATIEFSNYSNATTLAAPGFTQTYSGAGSGTWQIVNGLAAWVDGTNYSRSCVARYNVAATETDYQIVTIIAGGAQEKNGTTYSANYAFGRMNSTGTTYIYAKVSGNTITLGYVVSGSNTVWGTYTSSYVSILFGAGFPVYLHCGTQGGERIYEVKFGTTTVISHTEVGTSSGLGASYRYTGMGIDEIYSGSQLAPSPISAFLMQDNPPINYLGSGFRACRTSTSTSSFSTGYQLFPNSFLDTVTYSTDDYTWTPATNCKVTVGVSGWYQINVGFGMPINTMMTEVAPTFYKNGSVFSRGVSVWGVTSVVNRAPSSCQSSFNVYLQAGDYVQPGYWMTTAYSASGTMNGDTSGLTTYFEVTLANRSFN